LHPGAVTVSVLSLVILILFDKPFLKRFAVFKILPGALFVVVLGILANLLFVQIDPSWVISGKHLVNLPVAHSMNELGSFLTMPNFSHLTNPNVYIIGGTIALVGSLESLLSVEATDKLDPEKRYTPTNRELKAQGVGNIVSGLLGGLPITQVIVRSSANINSGGKSKLSTILHGLLLLLSVIFIPWILNMIPLASLAAILLLVGYKLSKISLYKQMYKIGFEQFIPFITTVITVLFTDLLTGIMVGIAFAIFYILRKNYRNNFTVERSNENDKPIVRVFLSEEVTFLNKSGILEFIDSLEENSQLIIDGSNCTKIDYDVLEIIENFKQHGSQLKNITLETINIPEVRVSSGH
jgi:MFS superfamily sulfate permease-like transporter